MEIFAFSCRSRSASGQAGLLGFSAISFLPGRRQGFLSHHLAIRQGALVAERLTCPEFLRAGQAEGGDYLGAVCHHHPLHQDEVAVRQSLPRARYGVVLVEFLPRVPLLPLRCRSVE